MTPVPPLLGGVDPVLMKPPVNVLRMSLHPRGLAPVDRQSGRVAPALARTAAAANPDHRRWGRSMRCYAS
jgi:hypothetical protein